MPDSNYTIARPGMTLAELLIALLLISVTLAVGYGFLHQLARATQSTSRGIDIVDLAVVRKQLAQWLGAAVVRNDERTYPFIGASTGVLIETLVSSAPPVTSRPVQVSVFTGTDPDGHTRDLRITFSDPDESEEVGNYSLLPAAGASARYLDNIGAEAVWMDEYTSAVRPPLGIEVVLMVGTADARQRLLQLPILIPSEQP